MAIFHCSIKVIKRSVGRSAVAAAAYRSGTCLINAWDGMTHDYTRKGGVVHTEILLPEFAPTTFTDCSALWNSVEQIEKSKDAQLAREIELALPAELDRQEQIRLTRAYVQDTFVASGMCADFAIHDKGDGNPHAHILLTMRPLNANGEWGAKCRKEYLLDGRGQRISDGHGGFKSRRVDTTDWNDKVKAEQWRQAWADYANRALERGGHTERIDHRSYERQGVERIPTVHMGVAATRMERRGVRTEKGDVNREVAAQNRLLKEIKARITRLYNWSKELSSQEDKPSVLAILQQAQNTQPTTRYGKVKTLKESAALFNFLQENGIASVDELHEKIASMQREYYDLRGEIVKAEQQIATLQEHLAMARQYRENRHPKSEAEQILHDSAARYLSELKASGMEVTPKAWKAEADKLTLRKDTLYQEMRSMRQSIQAVEKLRKAAEQISKTQGRKDKEQER